MLRASSTFSLGPSRCMSLSRLIGNCPPRMAMLKQLNRSYATTSTNDPLVTTKTDTARRVKRTKKVSSAELRKQRNKLAKSSLRDIFEGFLPSSNDEEEVFEIDPKPIYANPKEYLTLSQPLQQFIQDDLTKQLKKKWTTITPEVKQFHYFLCYDNHGPRESFPSVDYAGAPIDIPFKPHTITTATAGKNTKVHKQNFTIDLTLLGPKRSQQSAKDSQMDPFSKFVLFFCVLLTLLNYKRDSKVQSGGKIPVNRYEESLIERRTLEEQVMRRYEEEQEAKMKELQLAEKKAHAKKWYYLWLR